MSLRQDRTKLISIAKKIIERVLESPLPKRTPNLRTGLLAPPAFKNFRALEPIGFGLHDMQGKDWWLFPPNDCPPDLVWPLDVGVIADRDDGGDFHMQRGRSVTPKEVRGAVTRFSPFMVRDDIGQIVDGELWLAAGVLAWIGGQWVDADSHRRWDDKGGYFRKQDKAVPDEWVSINILTALALRQRYEWAVALGLENAPSVRFATDPTGIKDLFRIRDLPAGRDRREALMIWVTDHWRQTRTDPEIELYVRKHLRGAVNFSWRGMAGEVLPAQFDLEMRDRLIVAREQMRQDGTDRRVKA